MMGMAQRDLDAPVLKGTTGIVVLTHDDVRDMAQSPCIHCGRCLDACPMFLNPSLLGDLARVGRYEEMAEAHLADCMLCGSCSYVCPSNIPLAQLFTASKAALRKQTAAKAGAA
jgi:electron transport complex protein RnfC